MKKKKKTYILLIAVLGIWGAIGYQIYKRINPSTTNFSETSEITSFKKNSIDATQFYTLKEVYRDPFLGNYSKKKKTTKNKKPSMPKPLVAFPNIIYNGKIEGSNSLGSFIVTINGKQEILRKGDIIKQVTLLKGNKTSITILYNGEKKIIQKK